MDKIQSSNFEERHDEVQSIIEKMPTKFGLIVTILVSVIFVTLIFFGYFTRYPDIISGQITINANVAPLKLISNTNGRLKLVVDSSLTNVKINQVLAYIENSATPENVNYLDSILKLYNPMEEDISNIGLKLRKNVSFGDLNGKYSIFINSIQSLINFDKDKIITHQEITLRTLLKQQEDNLASENERTLLTRKSLSYAHKFYMRDSVLFIKKIISESEFDKTQMSYLGNKDSEVNALNNVVKVRQEIQQTISKIRELGIQNSEVGKKVRLDVVSAYNDLTDEIKNWKEKYVFYAPIAGKLQYLKFYNNSQFIHSGEAVFTIVPSNNKALGQLILPAQGSGKIKMGQEVIIKLDNYPYLEYGSIKGRVKSISYTTSIVQTENREIDTYLVQVDLPNQLRTNYGKILDFKADAKGNAEIITNDRKLIERFFENLKYLVLK